ncbi:hypothetical protein FRC03_010843 [Tulasnella sp. 419]|nr:hypothetical protein FRC03_010843 [Tulasnella sp. 419]
MLKIAAKVVCKHPTRQAHQYLSAIYLCAPSPHLSLPSPCRILIMNSKEQLASSSESTPKASRSALKGYSHRIISSLQRNIRPDNRDFMEVDYHYRLLLQRSSARSCTG